MKFDVDIYQLSTKFMSDHPIAKYPELMYKQGRPYSCLLVDVHSDYFICVPFRSSINHKNAFMFVGTQRSKNMRSGLDDIANEVLDYVDTYIRHVSGISRIHEREYERRYRFSTLPYFHDIMGIGGKIEPMQQS